MKKLLVSSLLRKGKEIRAQWDAGGDSTCCSVSINGDYDYVYCRIHLSAFLRERIIEVLNLPNAGEYYHKGEGIIFLNKKGKIGICFTSKEHINGDNVEEYTQWDMGDLPELKKKLHRVEVQFSGRVGLEDKRWVDSDVRTIYGEPIILSEPQKQLCEDKLNELLNKYETQLGSEKEGQELSGVYVEGILGPVSMTSFKVDKCYEKTIYHKDEFVVLM